MLPTPLVSIIMNCSNAALTLQQSLDSVFAQTYTHFEVIFFDSASQDHSLSIAQEYKQKNSFNSSRLKMIAHPTPLCLGEARNKALHHARGEYIAFLDCDDLWHPEKLYLQVQTLQQKNHMNCICTDTEFFNAKGSMGSIFHKTPPARGHIFEELVQRQWMTLSSVMIRKSALNTLTQLFDPNLHMAADADLFYRLSLQGQTDYIHRVLTYRRVHGQSLTYDAWQRWPVETQAILQKLQTLVPNFTTHYPKATHALRRRAVFQEAVNFWRLGHGKQARRLLYAQRQYCRAKEGAFFFITFFPSSAFRFLGQCYFHLPNWLRR